MKKMTYFHIQITCNIGLSSRELAQNLSTSLACSEDLSSETCKSKRLCVQKCLLNLQPSVLDVHKIFFSHGFRGVHLMLQTWYSCLHTIVSSGRHQPRSGYKLCRQVCPHESLHLDSETENCATSVVCQVNLGLVAFAPCLGKKYSEIRKTICVVKLNLISNATSKKHWKMKITLNTFPIPCSINGQQTTWDIG